MVDSLTTVYYDQSAEEYFNRTVEVDMSAIYNWFLQHVKPGGRIIDIGAGNGRDIKCFLNASLLHLSLDDIEKFFCWLHLILVENGVAYMSFKTGIATGRDEIGRFFTDVSMETVQQFR